MLDFRANVLYDSIVELHYMCMQKKIRKLETGVVLKIPDTIPLSNS